MKLFGWEIVRDKDEEENLKSIAPEQNDGSLIVDQSNSGDGIAGGAYGAWSTSFDLDTESISEGQLITKYREISLTPEVEFAIEDIFNAFASTDEENVVDINLDGLEYSDKLKEKMIEEFNNVLKLLDFNYNAYKIIRRWYVDGRLFYQVIVDEAKYKTDGIGKLTYIDPRLIRKIRAVKKEKDERTGVDTFYDRDEYYLFSPHGLDTVNNYGVSITHSASMIQGVKISKDSIVYANSGLLNPTNTIVLSYLHKAIRPLNQLRSLEDASIIYRLSRAPERRVFYIDVGNLPPAKAEQVLKRQMQQYRTKMVYDTTTGGLKSDPKTMTMIEDYWLPRRGDGKATQIETLPGGQNLGEMEEVNYFLQKLYKSLNVPVSRMDPQAGFNFGRVTEINRDEVKFMKFIGRLRKEFSVLFLELLKRQLALKNIIDEEEFDRIKDHITFAYNSDNVFEEAREMELMAGRLDTLEKIGNHVGVYYSKEWVKRNILRQTDEEIEEMNAQMAKELEDGEYEEQIASQAAELSNNFNQQMADQQAQMGQAAMGQAQQQIATTLAGQAQAEQGASSGKVTVKSSSSPV